MNHFFYDRAERGLRAMVTHQAAMNQQAGSCIAILIAVLYVRRYADAGDPRSHQWQPPDDVVASATERFPQ